MLIRLCLFAGILFAACASSAQAPFQQDSMPDGVVCFEAEHFHSSTSVNEKAWVSVAQASLSGGMGLQAMPNTGVTINASIESTSPRLDFMVNFIRSGRHYVAIRGIGPSGADDTVHAGIDGLTTTNSDRIGAFSTTPVWINRSIRTGTPKVYVDVPSPGVHTFSLWMREDGFIVDKVVLSTNANFLPTALGPPESSRVGDATAEDADDIYAPTMTSVRYANGQVQATFTPVPSAQSYGVVESPDLVAAPDDPVPATVQSFSAAFAPGISDMAYFAVKAEPVDTNAQLAALLFNRIAYGPTPDLISRVLTGPGAIGPEAFIEEQLAPDTIYESVNDALAWQYYDDLLAGQTADIYDLQSWYLVRAIEADRQLLEILEQFFDNHFTTYHWKTRDWLRTKGYSDAEAQQIATALEYREHLRWRQILMDPNGTFHDLLQASCESPSMIIYLDTVDSVAAAPNENFSREIMELFGMGVDNGYAQKDIEAMSPAWTGWQVGPVLPADVDNPHAALYTNPATVLARTSGDWWYRKGTSQPETNWNQIGYVMDTNWIGGAQTSIGYGNGDDNTVLTNMAGNYRTIYLRKDWVISPTSDLSSLTFRLYVDDGCIIWVNGSEVARFNVNAGVVKNYNNNADVTVGTPSWVRVSAEALTGLIAPGTNLIAAHVLNGSLGSSDLSFDLEVSLDPEWTFVFNPAAHATYQKYIFSNYVVDARFGADYSGQSYQLFLPARTGTNGIQDGYDIINHVADLPHTQEFICKKLCELFVHDQFTFKNYYNISGISAEDALIRDCMAAWNAPAPGDGRKGNIRAVVRTILESELFRSQAAMSQKIKTPLEYMVSAVRALRSDIGAGVYTAGSLGFDMIPPIQYCGMSLYQRFDPDGWPEVGKAWIDTGTVNERLRFIQNLVRDPADPLKTADYGESGLYTICDPAALVMARLPGSDWIDDEAVTDFFMLLLYPGEGWANLDPDRQECLLLLNSDDTGSPGSSPFELLVPGSNAYSLRIRSLAGLLMASPRFHEQ